MAEKTAQDATTLLEQVTDIVKKYDALDHAAGKKYNIFQIAGINEKEVVICRVIADLLNPQGRHCKGDIYLKLFWEIEDLSIFGATKLDTKKARVITEYSADVGRRIDIVITDGTVFIPMEIKIGAREQENRVRDYVAYSRSKNCGTFVPVLYLTLLGSPLDSLPQKVSADKNDYVSLDFYNILGWLKKCADHPETRATPSVEGIITQLIGAILVLLGYGEDYEMDKEILGVITQSAETIRAAVAIRSALGIFDCEIWELFMDGIFVGVQKALPQATVWHDDDDNRDDCWGIKVPVKNGAYDLCVSNDWQKIGLWATEKKGVAAEEAKLAKKLTEITGADNQQQEGAVWFTTEARYPGLENTEDAYYVYECFSQYTKHTDEVIGHIVALAGELEKA